MLIRFIKTVENILILIGVVTVAILSIAAAAWLII